MNIDAAGLLFSAIFTLVTGGLSAMVGLRVRRLSTRRTVAPAWSVLCVSLAASALCLLDVGHLWVARTFLLAGGGLSSWGIARSIERTVHERDGRS